MDSCQAFFVRSLSDSRRGYLQTLGELRDWGLNDYKMAEITGIERSKLSKLRIGDRQQPNYDDGARIMDIYKKEKRRKR